VKQNKNLRKALAKEPDGVFGQLKKTARPGNEAMGKNGGWATTRTRERAKGGEKKLVGR